MARKKKEIAEDIVPLVEKKEKVIKTKLVSYTVKAIIPTCQYGNIQSEITVTAPSLEEAKAFTLPHIEQMYKDYLNFTTRPLVSPSVNKPVETVEKKNDALNIPETNIKETKAQVETMNPAQMPPIAEVFKAPQVSESYLRATQAINSATMNQSLELIKGQIERSVKLTDIEKMALGDLLKIKDHEINGTIHQ